MASSAPEGHRTLVYATILFWQHRELAFLRRCIDSLCGQDLGAYIELRIVLIDNGCGARPCVADENAIELIQLPENRGFAGGHNVGIRHAMDRGAEYVLLFNSDAVAEDGLVRNLLEAAQAWPSAAFVGPLIVRASMPEQIESAGQSFNTWTARHREVGRGVSVSSVDVRPHTVDALSGCALLARREAVQTIGLLDERLFAYFEDMDWCLRARRAGYDVVVAPRGRVLHVGEGSTGGASPLSTFYSVRNHMLVAARHTGRIRGPLLMVMALGYHCAFLARSPQRRNAKHVTALVQGAVAAFAGDLGGRRSDADWN